MKNLVKTNLDLGLYHFYKGNISDAHFRFKLLKLCTSHINELLYYNLGRCYFAQQKYKKAKEFFIKALNLKENYPEVKYYIKKIENESHITHVPLSIIKEKFNHSASYYVETFIIKSQYMAHKIVFDAIMEYFHNRSNIINILDVGCGTGICAHFLRINNLANNIVGVDISSNMLDIAQSCSVNNKAIYNELINQSFDLYYNTNDITARFDLVLSVDSLCYTKDIFKELSKYKNSLRSGGLIMCLFRVSKNNDNEFVKELDLFRYSQDYIFKLSSELGMELLKVVKCQLYDQVDGILCMFKKVL